MERTQTGFQVMVKPRGPICNLACHYCYFLRVEQLYPGSSFRMSDELLDEFTRQYIASHPGPEVTFAWQGGEPTLMGLEFFARAVAAQARHARPGLEIRNAIQTNGVTLDSDWCRFFAEHGFLVGISIDGPRNLHDCYRVDKGGKPTFARVMRGLAQLREHGVDFNVLTTVHAGNARHPLTVYRFLRDRVGANFIQFIPIVEPVRSRGGDCTAELTGRSVSGREYGQFLVSVFDEWVARDVGRVYVQLFEVALAVAAGQRPGLCVFEERCGNALVMEDSGDLYSCDHFVEPAHRLGNLSESPLAELVTSAAQVRFGDDKVDGLTAACRRCEVRRFCNGGCPKNRLGESPDGEPGHNVLCDGYLRFFAHVAEPMQFMAEQLRRQRPPAAIMQVLGGPGPSAGAGPAVVGRNQPCPCGSGHKYKRCHGAGAR